MHGEGAKVDSLEASAKRTIFQQFRKCAVPRASRIPQVTLGAARYSGKDPVALHGSKCAQTWPALMSSRWIAVDIKTPTVPNRAKPAPTVSAECVILCNLW